MAQGPFLRKYNAATTINFHLFEIDGVDFRVDAVHAAGDTKIMKDEGAEANTGSGFVDEGQGYSIALTATEMSAARIVIYIVDQTATKAWLDTALVIESYGNASAQHAMDFDDAVRGGMTALPNAAAEAAGGLYTRGGGAGQINQPANGQIDTNPVALGGGAQSLTDLKDFADAGYDPATNKVQGVVLVDTTTVNTDMVSEPPTAAAIADAVWDEAIAGHVAAGSAGERVERLDVIASGGAGGLTNARAVLLDNLDALISTRATPAQVNTEVDTALADVRLDELLAADSDIDGAAPPTVGSVFHELLTKSLAGFTYDQATDSLEALRDRGDAAWITGTAPTAATIADAVWDEARAAHVIAGSFGEGVVVETNSDKTGYTIAIGGIAATSFAAGAINAAATATDFVNEIWDKICEDQASYTAQQIFSILLSACAGVTAGSVFSSPNGVATRITATLNASEERTTMVLAPSAGA